MEGKQLALINHKYAIINDNIQEIWFSDSMQTNKRKNNIKFTFIDLFAGIGGFRIAMEKLGGQCVFTSEWDKYAQKTYKAWFGEMPEGDIRKINAASIPDHDILVAGFPCQPFSIAGVSKKISLGRAHGFKDKKQGNLFFALATIIRVKRPPILFLENVKNLKSHDNKRTWKTIQDTLEELDYKVFNKVYDASSWVPQHRERVFIICFDKRKFGDSFEFEMPEPPKSNHAKVKEILEANPDKRYTLTEHMWIYLQRYAEKHKAQGNGFGFGIANPSGITRTLSARYYKDGSEILIKKGNQIPRRLTPRECARLMGFPDKLPQVVSDTQAYKQFGNAVVVPAVEYVAKDVLKSVEKFQKNNKTKILSGNNKF
jgi:DNA (cytosine-5)-methyltransferase 1